MEEEKKISAEDFEKLVNIFENTYNYNLSKIVTKSFIVLIVFIIYMLIPKTFWLIPSKYTSEKINTDEDPVMNISEANLEAAELNKKSDYEKLIKFKSFKNGKIYYFMPLAEYSISARLKEKNDFFYLLGDFEKIALVDYGLVWGDFAKNENFNKIYASSNQTVNARMLVYGYKDKYYKSMYDKYSYDYLLSHASHTHIIPANKRVMKVLKAIRSGQNVKLEGYLVDSYDSNFQRFALTSLSLTDVNESSRGNGRGGGACEVMYVTKVQVGDKIFE